MSLKFCIHCRTLNLKPQFRSLFIRLTDLPQVLDVLNVIDPGYTRDRGVILRHLSEADKIIYRNMFQNGAIGHDVFTRRVAECMILFEESQKCMSMLVKK